jgi:hypothetical protein
MIDDTISKIEATLRNTDSFKDERRRELLSLLDTLKIEIALLSRTDADQARRIAAFTETSADEAIRGDRNPDQLQLSLRRLAASVDGFETSHPNLVQAVNRICTTLSNLGI